MNAAIKSLYAELLDTNTKASAITQKLQIEWSKVFDDSKTLAQAIANAENASEYQFDQFGQIQSWYCYSALSDINENVREYFETWLQDSHYMFVDWENDCLLNGQGGSIVINDGYGHGAGDVWDTDIHKVIVKADDYRDADGNLDVDKRNALIEAHMERTGCFPGVFREDGRGGVFAVSTLGGES